MLLTAGTPNVVTATTGTAATANVNSLQIQTGTVPSTTASLFGTNAIAGRSIRIGDGTAGSTFCGTITLF